MMYYILTTLCVVLWFVFLGSFLFTKNSGYYRIYKRMNFSGIWFLKMFFKEQLPFSVKVIFDKSFEVKTLGVQKIFGILLGALAIEFVVTGIIESFGL